VGVDPVLTVLGQIVRRVVSLQTQWQEKEQEQELERERGGGGGGDSNPDHWSVPAAALRARVQRLLLPLHKHPEVLLYHAELLSVMSAFIDLDRLTRAVQLPAAAPSAGAPAELDTSDAASRPLCVALLAGLLRPSVWPVSGGSALLLSSRVEEAFIEEADALLEMAHDDVAQCVASCSAQGPLGPVQEQAAREWLLEPVATPMLRRLLACCDSATYAMQKAASETYVTLRHPRTCERRSL
jgi:hypothetical protein